MQINRPSWDTVFMTEALITAERATCDKLKVGAIIVKNNQVIASGYNGSIQGDSHCLDDGCLIENGHCIRTIHAEMNALLQCSRETTSTEGATIYVTHFPCHRCMPLIIQSGIKEIKYMQDYHNHEYAIDLLTKSDIKCSRIKPDLSSVKNILSKYEKGDDD